MISCVNKNDKNFKVLEKEYGAGLAEVFVRSYSKRVKLLPDGEFYIPTKKEFLDWYMSDKKTIESKINYILSENPRLSEKTIKQLLKGVIHTLGDTNFITSGFTNRGSLAITSEQLKTVFTPNYEMMKRLASNHPDIFEIVNTKVSNRKIVKIKASKGEALPVGRPDTKISVKYFPNGNVTKVGTILNKIGNSSHPLKEVAQKLKGFVQINNVDVELVDTTHFQNIAPGVDRSVGYFDFAKNKIFIAKNANVANGLSETLLLHEILHAFTYFALREDTNVRRDFEKLYDAAIESLGKYDSQSKTGYYANYTIDEFIVGLFTDAKFITALQSVPPIDGIKYTNLFEEIMNYLINILGLNSNPSLYNQAMSVASQILDTESSRIELQRQFYESDLGDTMLQVNDDRTLPSSASPKTLALVKDFIKQIGVDIKTLQEINVNGQTQDASGAAQLMQKLISVVEGKEAQALPEEAMHFAVSIIKQTNPKLYQKLMKEINGYDMLTQVFKTYGNSPLYQKDGKPDVVKLKEEAIAKVLVNTIISKVENTRESKDDVLKAQSWWLNILEWLKSLVYQKSGFDQAAIDVISGKDIGTADDIRESEDATFLQQSQQEKVYDLIKSISNKIEKRLNDKGEEKYFIDGKEIKFRVSDFAKGSYERWKKSNNLPKDEYDQFLDDLRQEKGTAGHADFEHAFKLFTDENGYFIVDSTIRDEKKLADNHQSFTGDQSIYLSIRDHIEARLASYPAKTRFMSEVTIYDGVSVGGTIDFLAIEPDASVNILDWKFMSLNTDFYTDVPWYKIESWNIQMNQYKKILTKNYGIEPANFKETRMIPILAKYSKGKKDKQGAIIEEPRLTGIKIGDVDVTKVEEDEMYLLPVATPDELTGSRNLDKFLSRLNDMYSMLKKQKADPNDSREKKESLNALFGSIRRLQIQRNVKPLIAQVTLLNKKIEKLVERYENEYKNKDWSEVGSDEQVEEIKSAFLKELDDAEFAMKTYIDINRSLREVVKDDNDLYNELLKISDTASTYEEKLENINKEFVAESVAKPEGFMNFLSPEKLISWLNRWFSSTSTVQIKSVQLLFRKANKALGRASYMTEDANRKLLEVKERFLSWANSKGLSQKELFSYIKKKDENELIDQYDPEFYKQLSKAIASSDIEWMKENLDLEGVREELEKEKEKEYIYIKNKGGREGDIEQQAVDIAREQRQADRKYNIDNDSSLGWYLRDSLRKHPKKDVWETEEWKRLNSPENAPAKEFYDYIIEQNDKFADLKYISKKEARVFLPFVRSSMIEAALTGKELSLGDRFFRSISVDEGDIGFGQRDEDGQILNTVPIYFTTKFNDGDYSEDLFRNMAIYNEAAFRYKYLVQVEDQVRAIAKVERNKQTIATSLLGRAQFDEFNQLQYNKVGSAGSLTNVELLDSMIKAIVYGQKYVDNAQLDAALFKIGGWGKTINEKIGIKVFPENLEGRQVTLNKVIENLNSSFSLVTLGFNAGSSISNLFGGTAQSVINAGKYFNKTDIVGAEFQIFTNKFNGEDKNKYLKALAYFQPLTDNYNREIAKQLSVNVVTDQGVQDIIMIAMQSADRAVQTANFYAFLKNTVVVDGKVVNAREHLRSLPEYQGRFKGTAEDRAQYDQKFEQDVKKLIEEKGVMKLAKVENGEFIIPGVDRLSNSVLDVRRKVQQLSKDALGNLSEDDLRAINLNIIGKSFMVFKNWIPRPIDVRLGGLKYNSASEAYEWGRMRMIMSIIYKNIASNRDGLWGLLSGNDKGMDLIRKSFEMKNAEHFRETGEYLQMSEDMFIELFQSNVKAMATDMIFLTTLLVLTTQIIPAMAPDDDEDKAVINQHKFVSKIGDKLLDELMYFYNPTSILNLVGSGPFPAFSLINNAVKTIGGTLDELYGVLTSDEERIEKAKPLKYFLRTFPITNQIVGYLPMFYPDIAKDLGIRMQSNYGIR
jgi:hypothetical protein